MASKNWSYSRVSCFESCKLKYKYNYVEGIKATGTDATLANKGIALHEVFEIYKAGDTKEKLLEHLDKKIIELNLKKEDYDYEEAIARFISLQEQYFQPRCNDGWVSFHEQWTKSNFAGPWVGAIDNILIKDKKFVIIDFKTAKSASVQGYANQLMLYAYMKGTELGLKIEEIASNCELYVFFPLASCAKKTVEERTLSVFKQIVFTTTDLENVINHLSDIVDIITKTDFSTVSTENANVNFTCSWCPYGGSLPVPEIGFEGCPASYKGGWKQLRSTKFSR